MKEVTEQEYNEYIQLLVLPTVEILEECSIVRTRHYEVGVLHAEKSEHTLINLNLYKIKQL